MEITINYRRIRISDAAVVLIINKSDLKSHPAQVERLLTGSERTIIHGNTFIQRNGYSSLMKGVKWDKNTEKVFIIAEKPILRRYEGSGVSEGVEYHF